MPVRVVIIGGGPAGNQAATHAARLGGEVTLVEREIVGGAAHLWDCIPSKTMIATGGARSFAARAHAMGLFPREAEVDGVALVQRLAEIDCLARSDDLDVGDLAQRLVDAGRVRVARSDTDDPQTSHRTSPTDGVVGRP